MQQSVASVAAAISEKKEVPGARRGAVKKAIVGLADSFRTFEGHLQGLTHLQRALEEVNRQGLRDGDDDDGYYDEKPPEGPVSMAAAREGLGEAGDVTLADSIWDRCVPKGLLTKYKRHVKALPESPVCRGNQAPMLKAMMEAVRTIMRGAKHTTASPSTTAFLKPKNATKCRLLLNATAINAADKRAPRRFRLPGLEGLGREMAARKACKKKTFLTKIDLTNCYWSIRLPHRWRRV